jgi:polar amino acid transport system substrate-binding protein
MRLTIALVALQATILTMPAARADDAAVKEDLAIMGTLFIGVVEGPIPGPGYVTRVSGAPRGSSDPADYKGVAVDLGFELAKKLGVELEILAHGSSWEIIFRCFQMGECGAAFVPVDEVDGEFKGRVDFASAHVILQSTYLIGPGSRIRTLADVDRRRVRVAVIDKATAARAAARWLKTATVANVKTVDELFDLLRAGKADAVALSREWATALSARLPGSRVLDGAFWKSNVAIAVRRHWKDSSTRDYLSAFIDEAIASGKVRQALDKNGLQRSLVPKPGTRP